MRHEIVILCTLFYAQQSCDKFYVQCFGFYKKEYCGCVNSHKPYVDTE